MSPKKGKNSRARKESAYQPYSYLEEAQKSEVLLEKMMKNILGTVIVFAALLFFIPWLIDIQQVAEKMDEEYRKLNVFNKEAKDYYGFFTGTVNEFLAVMKEYKENPEHKEKLEEAEAILFNFYEYKIVEQYSLSEEEQTKTNN